MILTRPGVVFEASTPPIDTGLVGTIGLRIMDGQGATTVARSTAGIVETPAGSGIYVATRTGPATGDYVLAWDTGDDPPQYLSEDLRSTTLTSVAIGDAPAAYVTVAEMRAKYPTLADDDKYPDDVVEDAIARAIETIEDECDVAFIPRETTSAVSSAVADEQLLSLPKNRVRSATAAEASTSGELDITTARVVAGGYLERSIGWPAGETITVTFTHGYDQPPRRITDAVKLYARSLILDGPVDKRATQISAADGGVINLLTPGLRGSITGIPEVDAAIEQYREFG